MSFFSALSLVTLGLIPSFSWIFLYLKKDLHPEPQYLVSQTFLLGMVSAPFVLVGQMIFPIIFQTGQLGTVPSAPSFFLWAAFVEEFFKFFVIWVFVIRSREFDEPVDAMIYLIVAGLGFAAMENILFLFKSFPDGLEVTLKIWALRFVGATFLHALAAGITGYFVAMAWFFTNHTYKLIFLGLAISTLFHFTFNIFILQSETDKKAVFYSFMLLIVFSSLISALFHKILQRQSPTIA